MSRGRGDAALGLNGSTEGETDSLKADRLAHGTPIPNSPSVVTYARSDPETNPVPNADAGPGSAGDVGAGQATWRRRVAPHLREVVREFFMPADANGGSAGSTTGK